MIRVFVYGTLKRGQRNNYFLRQAEFVGQHTTAKIYSMFDFEDYPAVCLHGKHAIQGEVYHISQREFKMLDDLEWYPHFYQRLEIPTVYGDAWMYYLRAELCRDRKRIYGVWPV